MRSARVRQAARLGELPDQDAGTEPVVRILTDAPAGQPNAFYMDVADLAGAPIAPLPALDDPISFDEQDGLTHKAVRWAGRKIRQRGYSFDWLAKN